MGKPGYMMVLLLSVLIIFACEDDSDSNRRRPQMYMTALEELIKTDPGLNSDMAFIAIDMDNFEDATDADKEEILAHFAVAYAVETMDNTFEELQEQGRFNEETMSLDGILLAIETVELGNEVRIEGSKYRSGLGAIGMEILLHQPNEEWEVKESRMLWISGLPEHSLLA